MFRSLFPALAARIRVKQRDINSYFFTMKPTPPWLTRLRSNSTHNDLFSDLGYDF